jgi:tetratricopeptide (TPR) repeat protein
MFLAMLLAERDDAASRLEAEKLASNVLHSIGEQSYYAAFALVALAGCALAVGDVAKAEDYANRALTILRPLRSSAPLGFLSLGRVLVFSGRAPEAVTLLEEGIALIDSQNGTGGSELPLRLLWVAALQAVGDTGRATQAQAELQRQIALREADLSIPEPRASFLARHSLENIRRNLF